MSRRSTRQRGDRGGLARAAAAARAGRRGDRGRRRQPRRHARARARRCADRVIEAPRGRAAQMNAGARASRGDVLALPACRHGAARGRRSRAIGGAPRRAARVGPLRRRDRRAPIRCSRVVAFFMNARSRADRHRHRRPGDVRDARARSTRRAASPRSRSWRTWRSSKALKRISRAGLPARARGHLGAALGAARHAAHDRPHVAPAPRLRARRGSRSASRAAMTRALAPEPRVRVAVFAKAPVAGRGEDAPRRRCSAPRARRALHAGLVRQALSIAHAARAWARSSSGARPTRAIPSSRAAPSSSASRCTRQEGATSARACAHAFGARRWRRRSRRADRQRLPGARRRRTCAPRPRRSASHDAVDRARGGRRLRAGGARAPGRRRSSRASPGAAPR